MNITEIASRVKSNWISKIGFGIVLTVGFPVIYFGVLQRHPVFPVTIMPSSWLDQLIPCIPGSVYLYESIWLLMPIAPWLTKTRDELHRYCKGFAAMSLMGFFVFFFFPTGIPRPAFVCTTHALYNALIQFDKGINACPSFHAAFAVYHGACCHAIFKRGAGETWMRVFIWVWVSGILASTLLTKQHVVVDIIAGSILGLCGYVLFFRPRTMSLEAKI